MKITVKSGHFDSPRRLPLGRSDHDVEINACGCPIIPIVPIVTIRHITDESKENWRIEIPGQLTKSGSEVIYLARSYAEVRMFLSRSLSWASYELKLA